MSGAIGGELTALARRFWSLLGARRSHDTLNESLPDNVLQLKVTLLEVEPPVWRRLVVPAGITLAKLHRILQIAMGWTDSHMHAFSAYPGWGSRGKVSVLARALLKDEKQATLRDVAGEFKKWFYEYDFGDGWTHEIKIEKAPNPEGGVSHAVCTGGARACPPDDIGGPPGYEDFLVGLADPKHEMHEEYKEWIGGTFDPEAFSFEKVNALLKRVK